VYQFRDRDRICCHDVSVTQCYALETVVEHGPMRLTTLAERLFVIGRFLRRGPWDFPVIQAGNGAHDVTSKERGASGFIFNADFLAVLARRRGGQYAFEACSGFTRVAARRLADPPMVGRCLKSFSGSVTLPPRWLLRSTDNSQAGLSPASVTAPFHGALNNSR
jgi:hypothetical protein